MVDEYFYWIQLGVLLIQVQIPLWSMNTHQYDSGRTYLAWFRFLYGRWIRMIMLSWKFDFIVQIPLWSMNTSSFLVSSCSMLCSDSSMVDEYVLIVTTHKLRWCVQIPLWSMNTSIHRGQCRYSSVFRFLYGRWIRHIGQINAFPMTSSDSSMVDEYLHSNMP